MEEVVAVLYNSPFSCWSNALGWISVVAGWADFDFRVGDSLSFMREHVDIANLLAGTGLLSKGVYQANKVKHYFYSDFYFGKCWLQLLQLK